MIRSRRFRLLIASLAILSVFAVFSYRVERGFMKDADLAVTVKLQERIDRSSRLRTSRFVSELLTDAVHAASPALSVAAVIGLSLVWGIRNKRPNRNLFFLPAAFALLILAEVYGKTVVHHPAPPFFLLKNPIVIFPAYHVIGEYSYPSGHAARAAFFAVALYGTFVLPGWRSRLVQIGGLGLYLMLVAAAVIYLGHHWASDVVGGILAGMGMALGFLAFAAPIDGRQTNPYNTSTMIP